MNYRVFGPFELARTTDARGNKILELDKETQNRFWERVKDESGFDLNEACGCYIFAHRAAKGLKPWYVGQSKGPFSGEVFTADKFQKYTSALNKLKKATPVMFFIASFTPSDRLRKTIPEKEAGFIEDILIGYAIRKNDELINIQKTKFYRELCIPGILNSSGKLDAPTKTLVRTLGL